MTEKFTPEFIEEYLFGRGLQLKDYFIHRTPISEVIGFVDEQGKEFIFSIGNDELAGLMLARLKQLNAREVVVGNDASSPPRS
jgi:hypothetical protein